MAKSCLVLLVPRSRLGSNAASETGPNPATFSPDRARDRVHIPILNLGNERTPGNDNDRITGT
ncbi:hypothetical protein FA13DRAFT_1737033 [Coprinellus micaceus]|uniref:Uncharacterized protein n=1 Tax=Coprinellus micaceus TaxID=71717 RepID=A0A4Y7SYW9_COPMI|nr:hypothetical protein FA13DRAFT_1737033 [Coprinellus micaceus]